ncbi:glycosyltransferase family 4 protein [Hydrogenimonas thermophila]|uniref:MraY family glycosyltransferase n=1 Tax=Hydrogenimonas thermophila TaxID=223786 RepID=UPI0029371EA0|nr:glycosyltransferase family 4 protein [Hydrogenimonas thermophila]WOE70116.1 glycosyltransferase family 4 protein [Hydrogenimonas thermophila]WOE72633.1 glycosyltransferase family 4 protein [Hydrogenimonas thermophila]
MVEIIVFLFSALLTLLMRHFALKKKLLDIPNERSSHTVPTPRGGGLAIVISFYGALLYFYMINSIDPALFYALLAALPIVIVSLIDDAVSLSAKTRLAVQFVSACLALFALKEHLVLDFYFFRVDGYLLAPLFLLAIIWLTNLYNFLDGIDGYAASQAIFVSLGAYLFFNSELLLILAAAVLGFLIFNWQKASIFMGDVGSAFLGFVFAVFTIYFSNESGSIWIWLVLLGVFWFDATLTLYRRYRNKESLSKPHKKHAYQRIVQAGFSHQKTVVLAMSINLIGLLLILITYNTIFIPLFSVLYIVLLYFIVLYIDRKKAFDTKVLNAH